MEVAPGIHRIEMALGERLNCVYLFVGDRQTLLVDTGLAHTPQQELVPYLEAIGMKPRQLRTVIITHADFDHMGGNAALHELAPDALFLCHELDLAQVEDIDRMIDERYGEFRLAHGIDETAEAKAWIRESAQGVPIDLALVGGERLRLGSDWWVHILHTPGHSRGHLTLYDPRSRSAVIADTALWHGLITRTGAPAFPPTYRYVDGYLASIQRLQALPIETLLTSHYPLYSGSAIAAFLSESRAFVARVEEAIRTTLQGSARGFTMRELIAHLGPQLGEWPDATNLVYPLHGHLERLVQYQLVTTAQRDGVTAYSWHQES